MEPKSSFLELNLSYPPASEPSAAAVGPSRWSSYCKGLNLFQHDGPIFLRHIPQTDFRIVSCIASNPKPTLNQPLNLNMMWLIRSRPKLPPNTVPQELEAVLRPPQGRIEFGLEGRFRVYIYEYIYIHVCLHM